jgi:hypothetical protein
MMVYWQNIPLAQSASIVDDLDLVDLAITSKVILERLLVDLEEDVANIKSALCVLRLASWAIF